MNPACCKAPAATVTDARRTPSIWARISVLKRVHLDRTGILVCQSTSSIREPVSASTKDWERCRAYGVSRIGTLWGMPQMDTTEG